MGDIRSTLEKHKVFNDTVRSDLQRTSVLLSRFPIIQGVRAEKVGCAQLMFYTSDNGAHCNESPEGVACGGVNVGRSTGGVR